jgi:3-oxoacyl-[acyl-carrier protein] reductase
MSRTIIVTGASKGIGRAAADLLAADGWTVIGIARSKPDAFPGEFIEADLADSDATAQLAKDIGARSDILGIVNNVGLAKSERFGEVDIEGFARIVDLNVRPALQLTQALLPNMRAAKFGRIINVTSLVTLGLPQRTSYAAAKAALESLTKTMAIELARDGITANAVAPGPTETELFRANNRVGSESEACYLREIPMQRFGTPAEIAHAIGYFASSKSGFLTGQTLFIDGGASLGRGT